MRKVEKERSRSSCKQYRNGVATIELTLFLPIYAAILMVLLTIFSFARTRGEVAVETRHESWMNRTRLGKATESMPVSPGLARDVGRILNRKQDPTLGLVTATRQKNASIYLKALQLFTDIQLSHAVMTDTWNYKTVPFDEQSDHPRLTLPERTLVFGHIDLDAFSGLASTTSRFVANAGSLQQSLNRGRNRAMSKINQARSRIFRAISATELKLKNLNAELEQELEIVPLDESAIEQLRSQIGAESKELTSLKKQLADLNASVAHLSTSID